MRIARRPRTRCVAPDARSPRGVRSVRRPGIDSSLSRVPPVCPSPRPDSFATASPSAAAIGANTSVTPSATPPVECLSTVGRSRPVEEGQRLAGVDHRLRQGEGLVGVEPADQGRHEERRRQRVGHAHPRGRTVEKPSTSARVRVFPSRFAATIGAGIDRRHPRRPPSLTCAFTAISSSPRGFIHPDHGVGRRSSTPPNPQPQPPADRRPSRRGRRRSHGYRSRADLRRDRPPAAACAPGNDRSAASWGRTHGRRSSAGPRRRAPPSTSGSRRSSASIAAA